MNVLAISVHPDDETLGCGGTLLKHRAQGDLLYWLIVTRAWEPMFSPEQVAQQARQVRTVEKEYPFERTFWLDFPTARLETVRLTELIQELRRVINDVRPGCVYVPHLWDVHSDHKITYDAAMAAVRPFYMRSMGISRILACEVLSETDAAPAGAGGAFAATVYSDITSTVERKLELMRLFETEMQPGPLPRSASAIRALARVRGATVAVEYAEAFMLLREII